jgi:hypothetical protein
MIVSHNLENSSGKWDFWDKAIGNNKNAVEDDCWEFDSRTVLYNTWVIYLLL